MIRYAIHFVPLVLLFAACGPGNKPADHPAYHMPATQALSDSIAAYPGQSIYYFQRAEALSNMDKDSLALEDVKTAQQLDSKNPKYNFTIGYLLLKMNKPQEAAKALLRNLEESPGNVNTRILLCRAYLAAHNTGAAQEQVNKVLAAAPGHTGAMMMQARIRAELKDTTAAIATLKEVLVAEPRNYDAAYQLADWYKASGLPEAIAQYQYTYMLDTSYADPLFEIGDLYEQRHEVQKAKEAYRLCLSKDRDFSEAYLRIGQILLRQDSAEKALRHFDLAVITSPGDAAAYSQKGIAWEKLHQPDSAQAAYRQALIFDPGQEAAVEGLKRLKK
ncbi:tetratricopeptide repeat protein [Taibaiella koreensis]|uniref:tetratricopeptide repeat protein n=1 Tax=Taibaiella koreensis TaxID=1268548 RepID=UPI000E59FFB4|nr:tetratricopeptide repeat protein [Taibaiella koreensis]